MTFSIRDLITPQTRAQFLQACLDITTSLGLAVTSWQPGGWTRTILTLFAQKGADQSTLIVEPIKGGFGDLLSSDEWADIWAKGQFDVDRVPARPATTDTFRAINASGANYPLAAGELIVANPLTGKTYRNQSAIVIPLLATLNNIDIQADEVGTGSDAGPNTITLVVSPSLIGVTVTNPDSCLGSDQELTPALITRARAKWGSLSPLGPKNAYDYVATTPFLPDGTPLSDTGTPITRSKTVANLNTGAVTVYIATAAGAPSVPDVAIVNTAIHDWAEPWGATATAVAAAENVQAVTYQVYIRGSQLTSAQIQSLIATALAEYFATIPIGGDVIPPATGKLYVEGLEFAIAAATEGVLRVVITAPAADVAIGANEVAKLGVITPTVTLL